MMTKKPTTRNTTDGTSQIDKFRDAARELDTDQSEEAFDRVLQRVVKSPQQIATDKRLVSEAKERRARTKPDQ